MIELQENRLQRLFNEVNEIDRRSKFFEVFRFVLLISFSGLGLVTVLFHRVDPLVSIMIVVAILAFMLETRHLQLKIDFLTAFVKATYCQSETPVDGDTCNGQSQ